MTEFYNLPFKDARKYLRRVYLDLSFIDHFKLDVKTLSLRAIYTNSSLYPLLIVNDTININTYVHLGTTEEADKEATLKAALNPSYYFIGYKHFDKWKFKDGEQIGDFKSAKVNLRLQRMIQKKVLGWKYWLLRGMGKL